MNMRIGALTSAVEDLVDLGFIKQLWKLGLHGLLIY